MRAFLADTEIDLPPDFSIPVEIHSPLFDILNRTQIGDFSMNVEFPKTPRNRIAFGFADELAIADKQIRYDNFRIEEDGEIRVTGVLELEETNEEDGFGSFDTNYFTLLLTIDIYTRKLEHVLTKVVNLGSTPAAIAAAGDAQNAAAMSTDGVTGAVMKFVPIYAPDFYGDTNKWWMPDAPEYRIESEYDDKDNVTFRLPEFIQEHTAPPSIPYAIIPRVFQAQVAVAAGQTPFGKFASWQQFTPALMNSQKPSGDAYGGLRINDSYSFRYGINRYSLLPYLQVHDVLRHLFAVLGYTVGGEYMDDLTEQRCLQESNLALDKTSERPSYAYVGNDETVTYNGAALTSILMPLEDTPFNNENGHYAVHAEMPAFRSFKVPTTGPYVINLRVQIKRNTSTSTTAAYGVYDMIPGTYPDDAPLMEESIVMAPSEVRNYELIRTIDLVAGATLYPFIVSLAAGADYDILKASISFTNLETDDINIYEGAVRYADHMPDMTVAEYLQAIFLWKNIHPGIDPKNRHVTLDYADKVISRNATPVEIGQYQTTASKTQTFPKRRYVMNYSELDEVYEIPDGFTELDSIASVVDLPPPLEGNKCILVRNETSYYATQEYEYGGRLVWVWAGYAWYDLEIEPDGELIEIRPQLGPVPIRRFNGPINREMINPVYEGSGRSQMFRPGGSRPALRVTYWGGHDGSVPDLPGEVEGTYVARSYPFVTNSALDQSGGLVLSRSMLMEPQMITFWKKTLQMHVLEERYTAKFNLPPTIRQLIQFNILDLIGYVAIIPIRTAELIGESDLTTIESRKIKQVPISIIGADGEAIPSEPIDINDYYLPYGLNGTIEGITNSTYTLLVSAPYNALITAVGGLLSTGSCSLSAKVNGVAITPATAIGTTYTEELHDPVIPLDLGDELEIEITSASGSGTLDFVVKMLLIP